LSGAIEEEHGKPQSGQSLSRPRLEPGSSRIQARSVVTSVNSLGIPVNWQAITYQAGRCHNLVCYNWCEFYTVGPGLAITWHGAAELGRSTMYQAFSRLSGCSCAKAPRHKDVWEVDEQFHAFFTSKLSRNKTPFLQALLLVLLLLLFVIKTGIWIHNLRNCPHTNSSLQSQTQSNRTAVIICGWGGMNWIHLAQDRDQWQDLVNAVMNLWVQ
jgi:hypothetical protein